MTREEAIKQVRVALERLKSNFSKTAWWTGTGEAFETLIPELKPDDETTRNEILAYIGSKTDIDLETHNRWCSYLEKQKEQKPCEDSGTDGDIMQYIEEGEKRGIKEVISFPEKYGLQKEQKPTAEKTRKPKFSVGDKIRYFGTEYEITGIEGVSDGYMYNVLDISPNPDNNSLYRVHSSREPRMEKIAEQKPEVKAGDDETEVQKEGDDRSFILDLLEEEMRRCKKNQEGARRSRRIHSAMDWVKSMHTENAADEEDEKVRKWLLEYFYLHRDDMRGASVTSMEILSFLDNHPGKDGACDVDEFSLTLRNCLSADSELTDEQADTFARAYGEDLYKVAIGEMKSGADKYDIEEYRKETEFDPQPGERFWVRCKTDKSENYWFDKGEERPAYAAPGKGAYRVCFDKDGGKDSPGIWYLDKEWLFHDFDIVDEVNDKPVEQWPNLSNCKHDCRTCFARCFYRKEQNPELWKRITGNELD